MGTCEDRRLLERRPPPCRLRPTPPTSGNDGGLVSSHRASLSAASRYVASKRGLARDEFGDMITLGVTMIASQRSAWPTRDTRESGERVGDLQARIDQLLEWQAWQQRLFEAIRMVNDESSSQRGAAFFDTLTARLATVLGADVAFVGQLSLDGTGMEIVSVFGDGKRAEPFSYCLAGTPCAQVIANRVYAHSKNVVRLFPEDTLLAEMGIHAYVGVPLRDADGKSIGILVGLFRRDLDDVEFAESVLLFFAPRVALEIQQARSEDVLRRRDEALHRLMDSNVVGFVVADLEGRILDANDAYLAMVGFNREDLVQGESTGPRWRHPKTARGPADDRAATAGAGVGQGLGSGMGTQGRDARTRRHGRRASGCQQRARRRVRPRSDRTPSG